MDHRKGFTTMWALMIAGIAIILLPNMIWNLGNADFSAKTVTIIGVSGVGVMMAGIVIGAIYYRCPHCSKSLMNIRGAMPEFCPYCGQRLKPGKEG